MFNTKVPYSQINNKRDVEKGSVKEQEETEIKNNPMQKSLYLFVLPNFNLVDNNFFLNFSFSCSFHCLKIFLLLLGGGFFCLFFFSLIFKE